MEQQKALFWNWNFVLKIFLSLSIFGALWLQVPEIRLRISNSLVYGFYQIIPSISPIVILVGLLIFVLTFFTESNKISIKSWSFIIFMYYLFQNGI